MLIHYGYEMVIDCAAPTPVVAELDVHPSRTEAVRSERPFETIPNIASSVYTDVFGNTCRRFVAPPGKLVLTCCGVVEDDGALDDVIPDAPENSRGRTPGRLPYFPARQPLLRNGQAEPDRLGPVWTNGARLAAGQGDLRLRPRPHHLRI